MKDFRKRVVSGSIWNIGASVVRYGFDVAVNIVLVRLLLPEDFGLVAMATVMSGAVAVLGQPGFAPALIQRKELQERHRSSVFICLMGLSVVLAAVTVALGPAIAWFYQEPMIVQIMPIVALQFPLASLTTVPQIELSRDLRFADIAKVNLVAIFISGIAGVVTAVLGGGIWSILLRALLIHFISAVALFWVVSWRPRWMFDWSAVRELFGFSSKVYLNEIFVYASRNLDTILIGKYLGAFAIGIYSRAYTLMTLPMGAVSAAVIRVLFAAFSAIQDDSPRMRRVYLQYSGALATFIVPMMLGLAAVAEPAVIAGFGPEWETLIPIVQIMAPSATWQGVMSIHRTLYLAKGRTDLQLRYTIVGRSFMLVGIIGGLAFGLNGVAVGFVIGSFIDTVINVHVAGKLVDLSWGQLLNHHRGVLLSALVMCAVVIGVGHLPELRALPHWLQLLVLVPTGMLVYAAQIVLFKPQPYRDIMALVERRRRK